MPIDPDLYEKYSGRRIGEAEGRYAESLAQKTKERSELNALKDYEANAAYTTSEFFLISIFKRYGVWAVVVIVAVPLAIRLLLWAL